MKTEQKEALDNLRKKYNIDYGVQGMKWGEHKKESMDKLSDLSNGFYGRIEDFYDDLDDNGFYVEYGNGEFVEVSDDDGKHYKIPLHGTERTIVFNPEDIEEIE